MRGELKEDVVVQDMCLSEWGCDWSCQSIANESRVFPRIQPRAKENSRQQIYQMRVLASYNHFCKAQNLYRKKTK